MPDLVILVTGQARHFKKELLSKLENGRCPDHELPASLMEELLPRLTAGIIPAFVVFDLTSSIAHVAHIIVNVYFFV